MRAIAQRTRRLGCLLTLYLAAISKFPRLMPGRTIVGQLSLIEYVMARVARESSPVQDLRALARDAEWCNRASAACAAMCMYIASHSCADIRGCTDGFGGQLAPRPEQYPIVNVRGLDGLERGGRKCRGHLVRVRLCARGRYVLAGAPLAGRVSCELARGLFPEAFRKPAKVCTNDRRTPSRSDEQIYGSGHSACVFAWM